MTILERIDAASKATEARGFYLVCQEGQWYLSVSDHNAKEGVMGKSLFAAHGQVLDVLSQLEGYLRGLKPSGRARLRSLLAGATDLRDPLISMSPATLAGIVNDLDNEVAVLEAALADTRRSLSYKTGYDKEDMGR